jgi:hypothetical protein
MATRIFSGRYGVRTLSRIIHFVPCIKIGAKIYKKEPEHFKVITSGPSRVFVNPWHYKVLYDFYLDLLLKPKVLEIGFFFLVVDRVFVTSYVDPVLKPYSSYQI